MANKNPLLFRYPPNNRYIQGAFNNQVECKVRIIQFGDSVTDKESYRLSLVGKRGAIGNGTNNNGWYMFPDGKYDHDKDFSFFYRKDLSIVDIDNYIKKMEEAQKNADIELKKQIQEEIDLANAKKDELRKNDSMDHDVDSSE